MVMEFLVLLINDFLKKLNQSIKELNHPLLTDTSLLEGIFVDKSHGKHWDYCHTKKVYRHVDWSAMPYDKDVTTEAEAVRAVV